MGPETKGVCVNLAFHDVHVPENVSFEVASLADIYVAIHAVMDRSNIRSGDAVVIFGPGFLGLSIAQLCRLQGADPVVVVGLKKEPTTMLATMLLTTMLATRTPTTMLAGQV